VHYRLIALAAAMLLLDVGSQSQSNGAPAAKPSTAPQGAQIYRNSTYGFRYQVPFGWVERTKQMQEGNGDAKGEVLLAVFERPPEATGDTVNSTVVIAQEGAASYPGLKKAEDYLGPLTELATTNGFKAEGDPLVVAVDGRELVRVDFTKQIGAKKSEGDASDGQLTMRQATFILLAHHQIVSFTFIAGSEDELDKLVDNLHFGVAKPATH
jgi:hypothetical protein